MKRLFWLAVVAPLTFTGYSCKKCATCTTISDDPQTMGETLTTEVCNRGKRYDDDIDIYTRTNWTCTEQE